MIGVVASLPWQEMPCAAHSLQLSANKGLSDYGIDGVLGKCLKIVGHFRHSPANQNELEIQQLQLQLKKEALIQDVQTRWNFNASYDRTNSSEQGSC